MNYLDLLKEKFPDTPPSSTAKTAKSSGEVENMPPIGTAKTAKSLFTVFAVGQVGAFSENADPQPKTTATAPYRLNIGGRAALVWLAPGLDSAGVLTRAKAIFPDRAVTAQAPAHGWPKLSDVPEIPASGTPQPVECWTPSGKRLAVTACSPEHAEQIQTLHSAQAEKCRARPQPPATPTSPATCQNCGRWCGTRSGSGWCVLTRPPVARQAAESCEQFTLEGKS